MIARGSMPVEIGPPMISQASLRQPNVRGADRFLQHACIPVPPPGPGTCLICRGSASTRSGICTSCLQSCAQVPRPCRLVVPISLTEPSGRLHRVLIEYKRNHRGRDRERFSHYLLTLLDRFLEGHRRCISQAAGGSWDLACVVPSTFPGPRHASTLHPLEAVAARTQYIGRLECGVLERDPQIPLAHNHGDPRAYRATSPALPGRRVLLLDDTFTTGARVQSAASTLSLAGAEVIACLVIGRVINPNFDAGTRTLWADASARPFSYRSCPLCHAPSQPHEVPEA